MEKRELKFYEAPQMEVVEMKVQGFLCISGDGMIDDTEQGGY